MVRFIDVFGSIARVIPTVKSPDRKVQFREKLGWTVVVLLLFLLMSNIPLYGISETNTVDYLYWMRVILASTHGTLMELGIGPIVTAGLIMQLLAGSKIIKMDLSNPDDRSKFTASQKALAMVMTGIQAAAYIVSGAYGTGLPLSSQILVFLQLFVAGLVVVLLDEMTQKGWGLGSGISLFIVANVAQQIMWRSLSPVANSGDPYWIGAIFATFQSLASGGLQGLGQVFWSRPGQGGSTLGLFVTIIVFVIVIYFETYRVNIPLQYAKYRGFRGSYPIKLLYVSNIPVILVQSLFATILFWVQIFAKYNTGGVNPWLDLIARFKQNVDPSTGDITYQPVGGLVYFITPPQNITNVISDPVQAAVYLALMVFLCAGFAKIWVELSGIAPRDIAGQLHSAGMQIPGFRRSPVIMEQVLERYIPVVALLGGMIVGLLAVLADFFGALGTGMGVLLTVGIIYQLYQTIAQEQMADMHPALRGMLGVR